MDEVMFFKSIHGNMKCLGHDGCFWGCDGDLENITKDCAKAILQIPDIIILKWIRKQRKKTEE